MNADKRSTDDWARRVLTDAVGDVEPTDRLAAIRQRTAQRRRRPGWPVVGGAVLATAAAVLVAALVVWQLADTTENPSPAPAPAPPSETMTVPVYYVGDTPQGPRLYREFRRVEVDEGTDAVTPAMELMMAGPADPDYRTLWATGDLDPEASFGEAGADEPFGVRLLDPALTERPDGMTARDALLAVQQLVYTLHAASGTTARVTVSANDEQVPLLGVAYETRQGLPKSEQLDVLAQVSISDPSEGAEVDDTLVARGRASSFEANVPWQILDADDDVVLEGFVTAEGWIDRLYPWRTEIDVSGLEPGEYTFVAETDDPSGGEGPGPHADTRTFAVR